MHKPPLARHQHPHPSLPPARGKEPASVSPAIRRIHPGRLPAVLHAAFTIVLIALVGALAACSSPPKTPVQSIRVIAEPDANGNAATALDIVFVYDTAALSMLPKSGPEWFERKAALVSGLANAIEVVALQVPPAMTVDVALPKNHAKAIGVYGFANYLSAAGQPVGNLTPFKQTTIRLTPRTVVYSGN